MGPRRVRAQHERMGLRPTPTRPRLCGGGTVRAAPEPPLGSGGRSPSKLANSGALKILNRERGRQAHGA
eukprot:8278948-Pyramimonas_sp.AAC.1